MDLCEMNFLGEELIPFLRKKKSFSLLYCLLTETLTSCT